MRAFCCLYFVGDEIRGVLRVQAFGVVAAEYLARSWGSNIGGAVARPTEGRVWAFSVHDIQNIFADVDGQRALDANKSDQVW